MIEQIQIQNYKSIKEISLDLKPINILIGPNGAGKSNFVSFFSFITAIAERQLGIYTADRGGAGKMFYLGPRVSEEIRGEINFNNVNRYVFRLRRNEEDKFYFKVEGDYFNRDRGNYGASGWLPYVYGEGHLESRLTIGRESRKQFVYNFLNSFRVYHFHDTSKNAPLKQTARVADTRYLRPDGSNLPAFLYELQNNDFDEESIRAFNKLEAIVKLIAPYFERFDLQPIGDYIRLQWRQRGTDIYLDASDLSDGTIRFIALATLLLQPNLPKTILIDEPELGLHPYALSILAGLMRSVSLKTQLIVSTQSVELVNQFEPENIVIVEHKNNESTFKRLDSIELTDWLADYSLGDLWQKNVIGGNP